MTICNAISSLSVLKDPNFVRKIILSEEAHFWTNSYVNKHGPTRTSFTRFIHCFTRILGGGVIGPYFIENDVGEAITVNVDCYRTMMTDFFWLKLEEPQRICGSSKWALRGKQLTPRWTFCTNDLRVWLPLGDVTWPPRSCDLTPLNFYLWEFPQIYANKLQSTGTLKDNITQTISHIQPDLCSNGKLDHISLSIHNGIYGS